MSEETKKCKHCQSDIPKKAKVCPVCHKKQSKPLAAIILGVIVFFVIVGIAANSDKVEKVSSDPSSSGSASSDKASEASNDSAEDLVFHVGETAEYRNIQITMTNIRESNGSEFNTPGDGNVFVLAEFEVTNNSENELGISSLLSFAAYQDGYATNLSFTALVEKTGEQLDGAVAPGKKMKGSIGYEIPADYKELEIQFSPSVWNNKKIVFKYEK